MNIQPPISETRRQDPMRQAELRVYRALAESPEPGHALYEIKARPRSGEVDFPVWMEGVGHFGLDVKGGPHVLEENGTWTRRDQNGCTPNLHLKHDTWQSVIAFREVIKEKLGRYIYIAPVLLFPDMEPDKRIDAWADTGYISVICGTHDLVPRLIDLAKTKGPCMTPPTAEQIAEEVGLFIPGPVPAAPALVMPADVPEPEYFYRTDQLVVQHADVINVYHNHPGTLPTR